MLDLDAFEGSERSTTEDEGKGNLLVEDETTMAPRQLQATITSRVSEDPDALFAYIFGSQVKGTAHSKSDVDIAVYFAGIDDGPGGDIQAVEKQISLGLELEQALRKPVDVVVLNRASIDLRQNVLIHGQLVFCRDSRAHASFKQTQLRQYQDFIMMEPIFRYYRRRRIEEGTFGGRAVNGQEIAGHH